MNGQERPSSRSIADAAEKVPCPHCQSGRANLVSPFGMFLFTARYACPECGAEFEQVRLRPPSGDSDSKDRA
jgi:DNA-directed RNA polymerase subunit RPC12/RpoP